MALSLKELNKRIDDLNTAAAKMGDQYQEVGLMCLEHLKAHGDIGPCNRLYLGMPKSTKSLAMGRWMVMYGALKINADRGTNKTQPMVFDKSKETNIEGATAEKWWETAPERAITDEIDLQVAIKSLLNRLKGKRILIGGSRHAPGETEMAVRTMCGLVGLPVMSVKVDAETGKAEVSDGGEKVGDTKPVDVPQEVQDAAKAVVEAAAKGAAKSGEKAGAEQGEREAAHAKPTRARGKAENAGTAGRTSKARGSKPRAAD